MREEGKSAAGTAADLIEVLTDCSVHFKTLALIVDRKLLFLPPACKNLMVSSCDCFR